MQREMPWLQEVAEPELIDPALVRRCKKTTDAVALSIHLSGYSQEAIAERLGISAAQLSRLKNGRRGVSDTIMDRIAYATGNFAVSQYIAWRDGFELVRTAKTERIKELQEELRRLEAA